MHLVLSPRYVDEGGEVDLVLSLPRIQLAQAVCCCLTFSHMSAETQAWL